MALVSIKFSFNEDVRRIKVSNQIAYADLLSLLKQLFKLPESDWENLSLKYTDNENDKCTVTGDQELREAFHAKKDEVLKLELSFPAKKPELGQSSLVNAIRRRLLQEQLLQNQQPQPQQPQQLEARRCGGWPERVNQRRVTIFNLTEEGIALMDAHKYNEAKEIFTKQAEILKCPWKKSVPLYNIACCEALLGNTDSALAYLAKAINCGYRNVQHMDQDKDLDSLRGLEAFEVMMAEIRSPQGERKKECRWKGRFQNMNCHQQPKEEETKPTIVTSPSVEVKEEKTSLPLYSAVTGEVVAEIKTTPTQLQPTSEAKVEPNTEVVAEPAAKAVEFEAELNSLFQMGFTNVRLNKQMLKRTKGNLSEAVVLLLR